MWKTTAISALVLLAVLRAPGQALPSADDGLKLKVLVSRGTFYDLEVIPLRLRLTNTSGSALFLTSLAEDGWGFRIFTAGPGEDFKEVLIHPHPSPSTGPIREKLDPDATIQVSFFVSLGLRKDAEFRLPAPGTWRLRASYSGPGTVESDVLKLEVKSSEGLSDSVRKVFGTMDWPEFVLYMGKLESEEKEKPFWDFYASGEPFAQSDVLSMIIGVHRQSGTKCIRIFDPVQNRTVKRLVKEPEYTKAIEAYTKALDTKEPHLKANVLANMAECHVQMENLLAAAELLDRIRLEDCNTAPGRRYRQMRDRIRNKVK